MTDIVIPSPASGKRMTDFVIPAQAGIQTKLLEKAYICDKDGLRIKAYQTLLINLKSMSRFPPPREWQAIRFPF